MSVRRVWKQFRCEHRRKGRAVWGGHRVGVCYDCGKVWHS